MSQQHRSRKRRGPVGWVRHKIKRWSAENPEHVNVVIAGAAALVGGLVLLKKALNGSLGGLF